MKLSEDKLLQISESLSGLDLAQWNEVKQIVEHLYHPVKKTLTSKEISEKLLNPYFKI